MDSFYYNHSYGQWHAPFSPPPPPPPSSAAAVPSPRPQSFPENPNFYSRSSNSGGGHHRSHHHYSHRHELPPPPPPPPPYPPVVNQPPPPSHYPGQPSPPPPPQQHVRYNPQQLTYESPRLSQPSPSSSYSDSRVVSQSAWVERKDTRPDSRIALVSKSAWVECKDTRLDSRMALADSGPSRNSQFDYSRLSRVSSGDRKSCGWDSNSRFRDEIRSLAYVREEFGATRIERNCQDHRGQFKSESGRSSRVLGAGNRGVGSSFGHGNDRYGASEGRGMIRSSAGNGGSGNERWVVDGKISNGGRAAFSERKDDYFHSEIERYCSNGSREGSKELNRTPNKQVQKKSALLRIETPRSNQKGRENDRSRHSNYYFENRFNSFRGKDNLNHIDCGLEEKERERNPVELDVSFKSNVLVAKAIESPTAAGVTSSLSVTPRCSNVRRVLMTETDEKSSLNRGVENLHFKNHLTNKASGSESFKHPERQVGASEKDSECHSSPSSIASKDKISGDKSLEGVLVDCKIETTDVLEATVDDGATKVYNSALPSDEVSNTERTFKCSDGGVRFAVMSRRSNEPQPCEDGVLKNCVKGILSTDLLRKETETGFEESRSLSSLGDSYGAQGLVESSAEAATFFNCKSAVDQLLANSVRSSCGIGDDCEGIHRKGDSLSYNNDLSGDCPEANNVSEDIANSNSFTLDLNTTPWVDSPKRIAVILNGSEAFETGVSPSVENVNMKGSMETSPYMKSAETAGNLCSDAGKQTCVNDISSFPKNVGGDESFNMLPAGRIYDCPPGVCKNREGLSDEFLSTRAISSKMCVEYVSSDNSVSNQDIVLGSHHPSPDPFKDHISVLGSSSLKACFTESHASPGKDINVGQSQFSLEREVGETIPSSCCKVPGSPAQVIDNNLAIGNISESGNEGMSGSECSPPDVQPCSGGAILHENHLGYRLSDAANSVWDSSMDNDTIKDLSRSSCLAHDSSATLRHLYPPAPVNELIQNTESVNANCRKSPGGTDQESGMIENLELNAQEEKTKLSGEASNCGTPVFDIFTTRGDLMFPPGSLSSLPGLNMGLVQAEAFISGTVDEASKIRESKKESVILDALQEQIMTFHEAIQPGSFLEHCPCSGQTSPGTDVESCEPLVSNYLTGTSTEKRIDDSVGDPPDVLSDIGSQENSLTIANADIFEMEAQPFEGRVSGSDKPGNSVAPPSKSLSYADVKCAPKDHSVSVSAPDSKNKALTSSSMSESTQRKENKFNLAGQKSFSRSSLFASKKNVKPPTRITKPSSNTWHRKSDTSASALASAKTLPSTFSAHQKLPKGTVPVNTSYVRKGNSLVRRPPHGTIGGVSLGFPPSVLQVNRLVGGEDNIAGSVGRADADEASILVKVGDTCPSEKQSTISSDNISKVSNSITSSGKCSLSSGIDPNGFPESILDSAISGEANVPHAGDDGSKISETLNQIGIASNCQKKGNPSNLSSSNPRKVLYVKRKSNQLVAASDVHSVSKSQIPPADGYFKRSKNQLIRTSDSHVKQPVSSSDDALDSKAQAATKIAPKRNFSSVFSDFAEAKPLKRSKLSLVWTLNGTQSRKSNRGHMQCQNILPQLVPWKRVTYWRRLMNAVSGVRYGSISTISRRLLLLRKRHAVYTRSTDGFSLRKSKVLSIGGSHLKWSKSIEKNSKKANEEATLAVAAFAKKNSEKCSGQDITRAKSTNHLARERIFRIGSVRYKMDPSRRTLQRISDVKSPCSGPPESWKDLKKSFIPKRLVIGNDEYVRVGNGNQLVRDPKKRTRVLANEKVRWSLYNARLRLARKKKYCQFFTRFGKCNKGDGKCPYIHDPSKIAVCTKFLNGLCSNPNCKLTHKVIPQRMPDCSYFLQGLCNNEACPYRHVHVNPNAPICEGFLRGYCSDGNECRKKHTNTCPVFEATGCCPQGSKCKLHHPKNRSRGRKRKRGSEPSRRNARGRYFGSLLDGLGESEPLSLERRAANRADSGGEGSDFIRIDVSEDEAEDIIGTVTERSVSGDSSGRESLYELIRPVRLMQK